MGYQICLLLKIYLVICLLYIWDSKVQAADPVFSTPIASTPPESVNENENRGKSIITIDATDADGDTLTYSIFSQTPNSPTFELHSGSGTLKTPIGLDAEKGLVYTFVFSVTDESTKITVDSVKFNVTITDINEFSPIFSPASYTRTIVDSVASGTTVTTVTATDGDATASVSYSIVSGNTGSVFALDTNTGVITTASAITAGTYTLTVRASDGIRTGDGTVNVTVNVDYCQPNPCSNSGTCANSGSSYTCTCTSGFTGTTCTDVNYCTSTPCQNGGTCTNGQNGYTCACTSNYDGENCENPITTTTEAPKPEDCNITCIILIVVGILILIAVVSGVVVYLHKTKRIDLNKCPNIKQCVGKEVPPKVCRKGKPVSPKVDPECKGKPVLESNGSPWSLKFDPKSESKPVPPIYQNTERIMTPLPQINRKKSDQINVQIDDDLLK